MILISGGAGFTGMNIAELYASAGQPVVITTHRRNDKMAASVASDMITVEMVDLSNPYEVNELFSRYDFKGVIHTATAHMFAATRAANFATYKMLFNCLEAATSFGVQRFVLVGSLVVYRGLKGPFREDMAPPPDIAENPPGLLQFFPHFEVTVKRAMELVALDYGLPADPWDRAPARSGKKRSQMQTAVVRLPWQLGPRYTSMYSPIASVLHAAVRNDRKLLVDRPLKDFMPLSYVRDSASGVRAVMDAKELPHRIYNVSSGVVPTAHDVLTALYELMPAAQDRVGLPIPPQMSPVPPDHLDITRIREDLGWRPGFTLKTMFADYLAWLGKHDY
jgi:nucleoside-diphosphate-sugar epimerase